MSLSRENLGPWDDDMADAGGTGSLNAKMRRMTGQLDALIVLTGGAAGQAASGAAITTVQFTGPQAVSGTVNVRELGMLPGTQAISGAVSLLGMLPGIQAVSGNTSAGVRIRSQASSGDNHAPSGTNIASKVEFAAISALAHCIDGLYWSYDADPTGGNLKIEDGAGNTVFSIDISSKGPGFIPVKRKGTPNTLFRITLAASTGATGKVGAMDHWTE